MARETAEIPAVAERLLARTDLFAAIADVKSDHTVIEYARVALSDHFHLTALCLDQRQILQVRACEIPRAFLGLAPFCKTLLQTSIGLVC